MHVLLSETFFGSNSPISFKSGIKVIKTFSCSIQISMKFILLINVKMPTFAGILTLISSINTIAESFKQEKIFFHHSNFSWAIEISCSVEISMRKFYNIRARICERIMAIKVWRLELRMIIWAASWDFQRCGMCDQQRLRPARAYAQSDQSLC